MAATPPAEQNPVSGEILLGDNLDLLKKMPTGSCRLIYIDPPFNTQKTQKRTRMTVTRDDQGTRGGFAGERYSIARVASPEYLDQFDDFLAFLRPRLEEAHRILTPDGSLFLHIDYREVHYVKVLLDGIFGRASFVNELIWAYDYGGKPRTRWPAKHDNILWYAKDPKDYVFNYEAIDRVPYMAPELVGPAKAALGKVPTDVWWMTIVPTNSKEKTGYPTQKPIKLLNRIIQVHSNPGDTVLDFFAGSGTTGVAAAKANRKFILMDSSPDAIRIMSERLAFAAPTISLEPTPSTSAPSPDTPSVPSVPLPHPETHAPAGTPKSESPQAASAESSAQSPVAPQTRSKRPARRYSDRPASQKRPSPRQT
jgi:site-specific DNA-methyltransferase (adenine-specific)